MMLEEIGSELLRWLNPRTGHKSGNESYYITIHSNGKWVKYDTVTHQSIEWGDSVCSLAESIGLDSVEDTDKVDVNELDVDINGVTYSAC
jgi:hypothetical protein